MCISVIVLIVFILLSIIHLAAEAVGLRTGRYLTKLFLMPLLTLYYVTSTRQTNPFLIAALTCGWLGDVFLMIPQIKETRRYFFVGVSAFILGHVFYMIVFGEYLPNIGNIPGWGWGALTGYIAAGFVAYRLLSAHIGKMFSVISIYIPVIVLMGTSTVLPSGSANTTGVLTVMAGAFAFMASDVVNAFNRFVKKVPLEWLFTMGFYLAGQYLLVQGYIWF